MNERLQSASPDSRSTLFHRLVQQAVWSRPAAVPLYRLQPGTRETMVFETVRLSQPGRIFRVLGSWSIRRPRMRLSSDMMTATE